MKSFLALAAVATVTAAEPQWLTKWKAYEPAQIEVKHTPRVHARGYESMHMLQKKMASKGYAYNNEHASQMANASNQSGKKLKARKNTIEDDIFQVQLGLSAGVQYSQYSQGPCVQILESNIYI